MSAEFQCSPFCHCTTNIEIERGVKMVNEAELHSETSIPAHLTQLRVRDKPYHSAKPGDFLCGAVGRGPETGPARKLKQTWIESKSNNESNVEHNLSMSSMSSLDTDYSKADTGSVCSVRSSNKSTKKYRSTCPTVNADTTGNSDSCGSLNVEDLNGNNSNAQIDDDNDDESNVPSYTISHVHRHGSTGQNKTNVSKDYEMNSSNSNMSSNLPNIRMNASYSKPSDFMSGSGRGPETPRRKLRTTPDWLSTSTLDTSSIDSNASSSQLHLPSGVKSRKSIASVKAQSSSVKSSSQEKECVLSGKTDSQPVKIGDSNASVASIVYDDSGKLDIKSSHSLSSSRPPTTVLTTENNDSVGSLGVEELNGNASNDQIFDEVDDDNENENDDASSYMKVTHRHGSTDKSKARNSKDDEMSSSKSSMSSNLSNIRMNASYSKPSDFMSGSGRGPETPRRKLRTTPDWLSTSTLDTSSIDLNASSNNLHQASKKSLNDSAASKTTVTTTKREAKVKSTSETKKESSSAALVTKDEIHQVQLPNSVEICNNKTADTRNSLQSIQSCSQDFFESSHASKVVNEEELRVDGDTNVQSKNESAKGLASKTSTCAKKSFLNKADDDSDDSEVEEQKYVAFAKKLSGADMTESQNHNERLSLVRKLDYGGSRPDDFMGGCGTGPTVVRRQSKATPSWLSQNQKEPDKQPKPVRRTHSADITRSDGPDKRSCSRNKTMDSCTRSGTHSVADKQPENLKSCRLSNHHDADEADTSSDCGSKDKQNASTEVGTVEIRRGSRRTSSRDSEKLKQSTKTLLGTNYNDDDESEEGVARSSYYKPNEYLGGFKDKNSNRRTVAELEERVTPIRTASYRRPGDFIGGGAIAPDNVPRRKSIDPSSIFGKK